MSVSSILTERGARRAYVAIVSDNKTAYTTGELVRLYGIKEVTIDIEAETDEAKGDDKILATWSGNEKITGSFTLGQQFLEGNASMLPGLFQSFTDATTGENKRFRLVPSKNRPVVQLIFQNRFQGGEQVGQNGDSGIILYHVMIEKMSDGMGDGFQDYTLDFTAIPTSFEGFDVSDAKDGSELDSILYDRIAREVTQEIVTAFGATY